MGSIAAQLSNRKLLSRRSAEFFVYLFYYRRLLQAVIILPLYDYPLFQVVLVLLLNLFYVSQVLHLRPYEDPTEQRLETQNELVLLLTIYFMILFVPRFIHHEQLESAGVTLIIITCLNFAINLFALCIALRQSIWSVGI